MHSIRSIVVVAVLAVSCSAFAEDPAKPKVEEARKGEPCLQHGVKKTVCARCNPKLAATFKAKGDWCAEHERPESQCVICHPELATQGVK